MPIADLTDAERKELLSGHVPKERFDEATNKLKDSNQQLQSELARLQGQVETLQNTQSQPTSEEPVQTYTRQQLRDFVENEQLTQDQADQIWDRQVELANDAKIDAAVARVTNSTDEKLSSQRVLDRINEFVKILPDIQEDGSDNREKVRREYSALAGVLGEPEKGSDQALKMQLAALERAFGSEDKLREQIRSQSDDRETMESLGGGDPDETVSTPKTGKLKNLSADKRAYYQRGIDQGRYKDWDEVEAELSFERKKK